MTKFESSIKQIPHSQRSVYAMLSDLSNIQRLKDHLPEEATDNDEMNKVKDKLKNLSFDQDSLSINVDPIGQVSMRIIERDEPKMIKLESEKSPFAFKFWIQVLPVTEASSKMKLLMQISHSLLSRWLQSLCKRA